MSEVKGAETPVPMLDVRLAGKRGAFALNVEFLLPARGVIALFGPSGSGKTLLLRTLAGLEKISGHVSLNGDVWQDGASFCPPHKRSVGYVFQEASLFPHLSVEGNLRYGQKRRAPDARALDYDEVVDLLGLGALVGRGVENLSGGERQRVAVGRALLSGPKILLMDEPLAALDQDSKAEILPYLQCLHDRLSLPVVYVSHDLAEVEMLADQMVLMAGGKVRATGPMSQLLADPKLPLAARPEAAAILDGILQTYHEEYGIMDVAVDGGMLHVPGVAGPKDSPRRLRVRAADVALCLPPAPSTSTVLNMPVARVCGMEEAGAHQVTVFLRLGDEGEGADILARITRKSWQDLGLKIGHQVHALIKAVAMVERI